VYASRPCRLNQRGVGGVDSYGRPANASGEANVNVQRRVESILGRTAVTPAPLSTAASLLERKVPFQFGLRSLIWIVVASAALCYMLTQEVPVASLVVPLSTFAFAILGLFLRDHLSRLVAWFWASMLAIPSLLLVELASGYGWTLPVVGPIPDPPSHVAQECIRMAAYALLVAGIALFLPCLVLGTNRQRVASVPPALALLAMLYLVWFTR